MSKPTLKEKQLKVYNYLVKKISAGLPPTVREICNATGIKSTSTVHEILNVLEECGYIYRDAKYSRAIRIEGASDSAQVPVIGRVTAGQPILAVEEIEDYIWLTFENAVKNLKFENDKVILKDARDFLINNNYISEDTNG